MRFQRPLPREDLEHVLRGAKDVWPHLQGARIFITGASGFFGRWLIESLLAANKIYSLGVRVVALSRNPAATRENLPHMGVSEIDWIQGSVATLEPDVLNGEHFDYVLHLATESDLKADRDSAFAVIAEGTRRALAVADFTSARRFLFTSSGAIYGNQPHEMPRIPEAYAERSRAPVSEGPYADPAAAKRYAEELCVARAKSGGLDVVIARCFSFAGPGLPIDTKFAFGNFIRDALAGDPIVITGDGSPVRSYLYSADLAVWLWTLLLRGRSGAAYNVGSERGVSIRRLADLVAKECSGSIVKVLSKPIPGAMPERYVPQTSLAQEEIGLTENFNLEEMIRRSLEWNRANVKH